MTTVDGSGASKPITPQAPSSVSQSMLTLQGLVSHVMDVYDLQETNIDLRRAKRSCLWGYEQCMNRHQWSIYDDEFITRLNPQEVDGDINISSSGVVTRLEPWPEWADLGSLYLDNDTCYRVRSRDSDTQLTLEDWGGEAQLNPGTWALRQTRIIMPYDVLEVYDVWQATDERSVPIADVETFRQYSRPWSGSDGDEPCLVSFRSVLINGKHQTEMRVAPGSTRDIELTWPTCAVQSCRRFLNLSQAPHLAGSLRWTSRYQLG